MCGDGPACGDGFECFEEECRTPVEVAAGSDHTCVRWASGRVSCWGHSLYGQSGIEEVHQLEPRAIDGIDDAISLVAGGAHTCALRSNGKIGCWGFNREGQLGNFADVVSTMPFESSSVPREVFLEERALSITAGAQHTCAIAESGRLYCWGRGGRWEGDACILGDDNPQGLILPRALDFQLSEISGGSFHTIGIMGDRAYGIGSNKYGQLSGTVGGAFCEPYPLPQLDVRMIAAGREHSCAADQNHVVRCIGHLQSTDPVTFDEPIAELKAGGEFNCARLASGRIECWGLQTAGVLGHLDPDQPDVGPVTAIEGTAGATSLDTGGGHACFVRDGDGVYCWGNNIHAQLGNGETAILRPQPVLTGDFVEVAPGRDATCARARNGRVWCWGRNIDGAVGSGRVSYFEHPTEVPGLEAIAIATGFHFGCAIDPAQDVWCWGSFDRPVNGIAGSIELTTPTKIQGASGAEAISAGWEHACATYGGGSEIRCWGVLDRRIVLEATTIAGLTDIATYDAFSHGLVCAIDRSGALACNANGPFRQD